ncbi:MAG TPA: prenyltransferase/squalene oxidase repeat-containing protein [Terriglobia bacterium]|nr:prenyltransferase/squalene oxidase repeat-containing protein [Terriglobia bacterium]
MRKNVTASWLILAGLSSAVHFSGGQGGDAGKAAEVRAVEFLKREVPAWSKNNGCFSCHNNGDAARALYKASQKGYRVSADVLADTTAWLAEPQLWDKNKGDPGFSDQRLANLQFALALLTALEMGHLIDKKPLQVAARKVAADQSASGAWLIDSGVVVGSPATYGSTLATTLAYRVLKAAALEEHMKAVELAERWLRRAPLNSVSAAAVLLLAATSNPGTSAKHRRDECLTIIGRAQTQDGGWGPYADSPPEVFDTAIVLLALAATGKQAGVTDRIRRGRNFLATQQNPDGGWPATTRPPGGESYAQRLSTTGWATLALLATSE